MFEGFSPSINYSQFVERLWVSKSCFNSGFAVSEYYPNGNVDLLLVMPPK
jgi:hypothetical protein